MVAGFAGADLFCAGIPRPARESKKPQPLSKLGLSI
jgi:hypothetical protein